MVDARYVKPTSRMNGVWMACCPFHREKTPSLAFPLRGTVDKWHCFGCGRSGVVSELKEGKFRLTVYGTS